MQPSAMLGKDLPVFLPEGHPRSCPSPLTHCPVSNPDKLLGSPGCTVLDLSLSFLLETLEGHKLLISLPGKGF